MVDAIHALALTPPTVLARYGDFGGAAMNAHAELRASLGGAMDSGDPTLSAADRLCQACVELLDVDGAAISLTLEGSSQGTFASSGGLSRQLDEFQFTFGEAAARPRDGRSSWRPQPLPMRLPRHDIGRLEPLR
jgi:hypothetical protein